MFGEQEEIHCKWSGVSKGEIRSEVVRLYRPCGPLCVFTLIEMKGHRKV